MELPLREYLDRHEPKCAIIAVKLARVLKQPLEVFLPSEEKDAGPVKAKATKPKRKRG